MNETCERLKIGAMPAIVEAEHMERYKFAQIYAQGKVALDIACGTGYGSRMLLDGGALNVVGIDLSEDAISYAKEKYECESLTFFLGDAENLISINNNIFDVVFSFETIEHVPHVQKYLSEIYRVLKPGGTFFVSTPDRRLASVLYPITRKPAHPFHIKEYTYSEFISILETKFMIVDKMGQAYISQLLVLWPVQIFFKALKNILPLKFIITFVDKLYHIGSGLPVQKKHKSAIARFWLIKCKKPL